jgi:hypothetical protein
MSGQSIILIMSFASDVKSVVAVAALPSEATQVKPDPMTSSTLLTR